MKKCMVLLLALALCLMLTGGAPADGALPACKNPEHSLDDGLDHRRPDPCWVYGHFNCDGRDHNRASCRIGGHYGCDGRDHGLAACGAQGHYACVNGTHAIAACGIYGHCVRDGKHHVRAGCGLEGHYLCDGLQHRVAACGIRGHLGCDGKDHSAAVCRAHGHMNCDGLEHAPAPCGVRGHCISDGKTHEAAPCLYNGHMLCDGRRHEPAACGVEGHYACEVRSHLDKPLSKYCNAVPQHRVCEGNPLHYCDPAQGGCGVTYNCTRSNAHTACRMCGLLWCDHTLGAHEAPCHNDKHRPCVYRLNGKLYDRNDHKDCGYCGSPLCNGRAHGNRKCVNACPKCGGPEKFGKTHEADCGKHLWCQGGKHSWCDTCKAYKCASLCEH